MATSRKSIVRGPGAIQIGNVTIHDASGITCTEQSPIQDIPSSMVGQLDHIKTDQTLQVQATPCGSISPDIIKLLFPHQTPSIGASLMGEVDTPLVIHSRAGVKVTIPCAALALPPQLILSPIATSFGQATWYGCVALAKGPTDTDSFHSVTNATYNLGEPSRAGLTGHHYTGLWNTLDIPDTEAGWTVEIVPTWTPVAVDSIGTIDWTLASIVARARCVPVGLSESAILAALAGTKARGSSISTAHDLTISSASGLTVKLFGAGLETGPLRWGTTTLRAGELGFVANITGGQLYSVAASGATPPAGG